MDAFEKLAQIYFIGIKREGKPRSRNNERRRTGSVLVRDLGGNVGLLYILDLCFLLSFYSVLIIVYFTDN